MLTIRRLRREGDGDCGIWFDCAVYDAMTRGDARVLERVVDATRLCNFAGGIPKSIFFGLEKSGGQQLIGTAEQIFTGESKVFSGAQVN